MTPTSRTPLVIAVTLALLGGSTTAHADAKPKAPAISSTDTEVAITDLSPGGRLLFFGLAHSQPAHTLRILRHLEVFVDETRSGTVRVAAPRLVDSPSVYAAVDIETGASTMARIGEGGRSLPRPRRASERSEALTLPNLSEVEAMLIRPGKGAWAVRTSDGGALEPRAGTDEATADGSVEIDLATFVALGQSGTPPTALASGDVLVIADPRDLSIGAFELGPEGWVTR